MVVEQNHLGDLAENPDFISDTALSAIHVALSISRRYQQTMESRAVGCFAVACVYEPFPASDATDADCFVQTQSL